MNLVGQNVGLGRLHAVRRHPLDGLLLHRGPRREGHVNDLDFLRGHPEEIENELPDRIRLRRAGALHHHLELVAALGTEHHDFQEKGLADLRPDGYDAD